MTAAWSAEAYACCQPWKQARYSAAVVALVRIIFTGEALVIQKTLGEKRHGGACGHREPSSGMQPTVAYAGVMCRMTPERGEQHRKAQAASPSAATSSPPHFSG